MLVRSRRRLLLGQAEVCVRHRPGVLGHVEGQAVPGRGSNQVGQQLLLTADSWTEQLMLGDSCV